MTVYGHRRYTLVPGHGHTSHKWTFIGPRGGVEFSATEWVDPDIGITASIDIHYARGGVPEYMANQPPSHLECWLTKEPCWHDGETTYATEHLWPQVKSLLANGNHDAIFGLLERRANDFFRD